MTPHAAGLTGKRMAHISQGNAHEALRLPSGQRPSNPAKPGRGRRGVRPAGA